MKNWIGARLKKYGCPVEGFKSEWCFIFLSTYSCMIKFSTLITSVIYAQNYTRFSPWQAQRGHVRKPLKQ